MGDFLIFYTILVAGNGGPGCRIRCDRSGTKRNARRRLPTGFMDSRNARRFELSNATRWKIAGAQWRGKRGGTENGLPPVRYAPVDLFKALPISRKVSGRSRAKTREFR
jgi:hypothetical protein